MQYYSNKHFRENFYMTALDGVFSNVKLKIQCETQNSFVRIEHVTCDLKPNFVIGTDYVQGTQDKVP